MADEGVTVSAMFGGQGGPSLEASMTFFRFSLIGPSRSRMHLWMAIVLPLWGPRRQRIETGGSGNPRLDSGSCTHLQCCDGGY